MNAKSIALALTVVVIWGVNFSVIKVGLHTLPPILFSGLRFLIVAIPAVLFVPRPRVPLWQLLTVGLSLGVIKFSLLFVAMDADASAGIASLLLQAQVIFTILLSAVLLREVVTRAQGLGLFIALSGFALFFLTTTGSATLTGVTMIVAAAFLRESHAFYGMGELDPSPATLRPILFTGEPTSAPIAASYTAIWLVIHRLRRLHFYFGGLCFVGLAIKSTYLSVGHTVRVVNPYCGNECRLDRSGGAIITHRMGGGRKNIGEKSPVCVRSVIAFTRPPLVN